MRRIEYIDTRLQELWRLFKFATVGASGFVLNIGFLYFFTDIVGFFYIISALIVFAIVESYQYLANNFFTFHDRRVRNHVIGGSKYVAMLAAYNTTYLGLLAGFTELAGLYYLLSSVLAIGLAFIPKYLICWRWIWNYQR